MSSVNAQCDPNGHILTGSSGSFSSPNYPSDYPNSATCRWIISVPKHHRIQLTFQTFVFETCLVPSICTCDHVEVRDGSDGNSPQLGKFCGKNKPPPVQSSGRYMWVEFDSDLTRHEKGFRSNYTAVGNVSIPVRFCSFYLSSARDFKQKFIIKAHLHMRFWCNFCRALQCNFCRNCKLAAFSLRFQSDICCSFPPNRRQVASIKFRTCLKPLRYRGDKSHRNCR